MSGLSPEELLSRCVMLDNGVVEDVDFPDGGELRGGEPR